jgi:hypothetical protein
MPLKFFDEFTTQVGSAEYVLDIKKAIEYGTAVPDTVTGQPISGLPEQVFEPEEGANALI